MLKISFDDAQLITSSDFKLNYSNKKYISGTVYDLIAMQQVVFKILNTERFLYPIYSWNYGVELLDLFGKPVSFVCVEAQRRIAEALVFDERINSVSDFAFDLSVPRCVSISFTVFTIFGSFSSSKEVDF